MGGPRDLSSRKGFFTPAKAVTKKTSGVQAEMPRPIPPRSVVELIRADKGTPEWKQQIGRQFRIGYYSPQDGLDVVWLVDAAGEYCQTTDHDYLSKYFRIVRIARETDVYGTKRAKLRRLTPSSSARRPSARPHRTKAGRPR